MKPYLIALLGLIPICVSAQVTPNLQLQLPVEGSSGWGSKLNQNATMLDSYLSGGTSLPQITVTGAITNANQLATKAYVDAHSGAFTLTTTGSSGAATLSNGVLNVPQYAGVQADWNASSGPAVILNKPTLATVATSGSYTDLTSKPTIPAAQVNSDWNSGSGLSQILNKPSLATVATSGSYTDLSNRPLLSSGQMLYNQSGDTIASIETACSSLCTYIVTTPQTITLAANHTLSSNVQLDFRAGGQWTVNGAFTLTIPGNVTGTLNQHFAGSSTIAFGQLQQFAPVEWFGAVGDGSTDDHAAIQSTLNALSAGQAVLQARTYSVGTSTLTISKSIVGIVGGIAPTVTNTGVFSTPLTSSIVSASASADIIDVAGTGGTNYLTGNVFKNFNLRRSILPTGTAKGLSVVFTYGTVLEGIVSEDSISDFYFHGVGSQGIGYINDCAAQWGKSGVVETSGTYYGFNLDSTGGVQNPSFRMTRDFVYGGGIGGTTTYGLYSNGTAVNDLMAWNFETASLSYGIYINGSGALAYGGQDIHLINPINDLCALTCITINNVVNATNSSVDIDGGFMFGGSSGVLISSSNNVTVRGMQDGSDGNAIATSSSTNVSIVANNLTNQTGDGIVIIGGSNIAVTGNTVTGNSIARGLVRLTSSPAHVTITGNTFAGTGNAGVVIEAGSSDVEGIETNTFASTLTNKITDASIPLFIGLPSETVTFSATPTFANYTRSSIITLTANITSFTLAAGVDGQQKTLTFCQNGTGSFTVAAPANVRGFFTVGATASKCSTQGFTYSAGQTAWLANSPGVTNQ